MTKILAIATLFLAACSSDPLSICTDTDAGPQCLITGGAGVASCDQCTTETLSNDTACGYCASHALIGPSVPVRRFNGLWCVGNDTSETDRVDCSGCAP